MNLTTRKNKTLTFTVCYTEQRVRNKHAQKQKSIYLYVKRSLSTVNEFNLEIGAVLTKYYLFVSARTYISLHHNEGLTNIMRNY